MCGSGYKEDCRERSLWREVEDTELEEEKSDEFG